MNPPPTAHPEPTVAIDALCVQNEAWGDGFLRVMFDPGVGAGGCDNVVLTLKDQSTGKCHVLMNHVWCGQPHVFQVLVGRHPLGPVIYDINLDYNQDGRRMRLEGNWATVSIANEQVPTTVSQLVLNITNNITTGHACDVNCSSQVKDQLDQMLKSGNGISQHLQNLVCGTMRAYAYLDLFNPNDVRPLPKQPREAKTDRLMLDFGKMRILLFSAQEVTFGRASSQSDIFWRHPFFERLAKDDPANNDYLKISRRQCVFEHSGRQVIVSDGGRDEKGRVTPSTGGTYYNAVRIKDSLSLTADGTGTGLITFSDSAATGTLTVCQPGEVCATCTRADRGWCANGKSPSLVFKRCDGMPETAVMVWSCFRLEEVAPSFAGVKIFWQDGGFAWRRGPRRCGWLVPGEAIETDWGTVHVLALKSPAEIWQEKEKERMLSETIHN